MIKEIRLLNWKSFSKAVLPIDPLTVLIGTNASGKSNALDGLAFLNNIGMGKDFMTALKGESTPLLGSSFGGIRGGVEWAALKPGNQFTLEALIQEDKNTDYLFSITINTYDNKTELYSESLTQINYEGHSSRNIRLYWAELTNHDNPSITAKLYNKKAGTKKECRRSSSILSQLKDISLRKEIRMGIDCVSLALEEIFILDPIPSHMRNFSSLSSTLTKSASNIAGVLVALDKLDRASVVDTITKYFRKLPEGDISKFWAESVGRLKTDAMLYCDEKWAEGKKLTVDARGMSDGTLRFIAIMTALLTRPPGSLIVIEEVDNGLHPSRTGLLLDILKDVGIKRNIDILITTHNPALLDMLGPEMVPFVVVSHRDKETGESKLTLLEDIDNLPKLLTLGPLGALATKGSIERGLNIKQGAGE